ncbi:MAG: hypothetical protein GYB68_18255 [Chloroflexi bacterium]|nr:hypothetical protein [Chloroflexota bacterium]
MADVTQARVTMAEYAQLPESNLPCEPIDLDLVVEVLSSSTARRIKRDKSQVYERHGTRENRLIDLNAQSADCFEHGGIFGPEHTITSKVIGSAETSFFSLYLADVFQ